MYAKQLREQLAPLAAQITAITAKAKSENNRGLTGEEREQFHKLEHDYTALEDSIACAEKEDDIVARLAAVPGGKGNMPSDLQLEEIRDTYPTTPKLMAERRKDPHYRAFSNFLHLHPRMSVHDMPQEDREMLNGMNRRYMNAQQSTGGALGSFGPEGGYLVPTGFSDMLEEAKKWFGGIAGVVDKFTTATGAPLPWPTVNDTTNKGRIIGQDIQVTETDFVFNQVTFNAYIGSSDIVLIPLAMIQDAFFDMDALTARLLGTRLGRLYNWKCTTGAGTIEPTGIVTAALAAGATYTMATGQNYLPKYADLVALEHTVDPAYRFNPSTRWMFSDTILKALKLLVDGQGRPLWQPGLTASFREGAAVDLVVSKPTILDHPYIINQDMPVPAQSQTGVMLFGDMNLFKVREVSGGTSVMRLVERYADYLQVGFTAWQRFDSMLLDAGTHPVAVANCPGS
jgi:HK97 family phage major capsid protein